MKQPYKIENIEDLISFVNEYYESEHYDKVLSVVGKFLGVAVIAIKNNPEPKASFIKKVEDFYEYCLTNEDKPPFLMKNPQDEFEMKRLLESYY